MVYLRSTDYSVIIIWVQYIQQARSTNGYASILDKTKCSSARPFRSFSSLATLRNATLLSKHYNSLSLWSVCSGVLHAFSEPWHRSLLTSPKHLLYLCLLWSSSSFLQRFWRHQERLGYFSFSVFSLGEDTVSHMTPMSSKSFLLSVEFSQTNVYQTSTVSRNLSVRNKFGCT